jgi:hypothetical protein
VILYAKRLAGPALAKYGVRINRSRTDCAIASTD